MSRDGAANDLALSVYLRELRAGRQPDSELLSRAWEKLRSIVIGVLRRRGLWSTTPRYLGIEDAESWSFSKFDPSRPESRQSYSAIDQLSVDCLISIQERCHTYVEEGRNVDALIAGIVQQIIHKKQQHHDHLGFRAFIALRDAVRRLLDGGKLILLAGDSTINNSTILGFSSGDAQCRPTALPTELRTWNDGILSGILFGQLTRAILRQLGDCILSFREAGVEAFAFKNALDRFRDDLRRLNQGIWQHDPAVSERMVMELPGTRIEEQDFLEKRQDCVAQLLPSTGRGQGMRARTREHLVKLWSLTLCRPAELAEGRFSAQRLEEILGIPRKKIPRLIATLRQLVVDCEKQLMEPLDER